MPTPVVMILDIEAGENVYVESTIDATVLTESLEAQALEDFVIGVLETDTYEATIEKDQ